MKKTFFLFAMFTSVASGAQVAVSNTAVDYAAKKITFTVSWTTTPNNNKIWLLADYRKIENNAETGNWSRALIAAATKTAGVGSASTVAGNTRGFWLNTSGSSGSATVLATLAIPDEVTKFNWCAYAFDSSPAATIKAAGGYDLHGTPPFTINVTMTVNTKTFGAGTCITSITDFTGNPDGVAAQPSLSSPNSPSRCSAGVVTLSVTVSGGTTTAMMYTWNIGGTPYTNQTNSYTTGSLSANTTYSVKVKNANNCESNTASGSITINAVPAAPTNASNNSRCGTGTVAFSASAPSGCTIDWYNASTNGSTVATGTTSYSPSLSTTTTYYAQSRHNTTGCVSTSRLTVTATINQPGANGQTAHATCGCAAGLSKCNGGTCRSACQTYSDNGCLSLCAGYNWAYNNRDDTSICACAMANQGGYSCNFTIYRYKDGNPVNETWSLPSDLCSSECHNGANPAWRTLK